MRVTVNRLSSDSVRVRRMVGDRVMIRREEPIDFSYLLGQLGAISYLSDISRDARDIYKAIEGAGLMADVPSSVSSIRNTIAFSLDRIERAIREFQQRAGSEALRMDAEGIKSYVQNIRNIVSGPSFDASWKSCDTANRIYADVINIEYAVAHLMSQVSSLVYQYLRDRSPSVIEMMNRYSQLLQRANR